MKSRSLGFQIKEPVCLFEVVLFTMPYKVMLTFKCANEMF